MSWCAWRSGGVRDVLGALYAEGPKCAAFGVVMIVPWDGERERWGGRAFAWDLLLGWTWSAATICSVDAKKFVGLQLHSVHFHFYTGRIY